MDESDVRFKKNLGGYPSNYIHTQILDVDTLEWEEGFDLPNNLAFSGHVDFGDTTLIIGGWDGDYYDYILAWNPDTLSWSQMEERLSTPLDRTCAILIDDDKADCI